MNKAEQAFQQAIREGDSDFALTIAERAVKKMTDPTERALWRKRAESLRKGRALKFSRQEVRHIK